MSRLDEIVELIEERESHFSMKFMEQMIEWMGRRRDKEVVELMRTACTELAWRATGGEGEDTDLFPSDEVFYEATERIARVFHEQTRERNIKRGGE